MVKFENSYEIIEFNFKNVDKEEFEHKVLLKFESKKSSVFKINEDHLVMINKDQDY